MKAVRKSFLISADDGTLASKRQVAVLCSTNQPDRMGDIVVQEGIDFSNFLATRTVLWDHDQAQPVAKCVEIGIVGGSLRAIVEFPPAADDPPSDLIYTRIKNGIINGVSIGFLPLVQAPIDPQNPRKGFRISKSELLEFSFVSVPANPGAVIVERSMSTPNEADAVRKAFREKVQKSVVKAKTKGLYDLSNFAYVLMQLGWICQDSASEANWEGDGSTVPAMLETLCQTGAEAFLAMTSEEVAEFLAMLPGAQADDDEAAGKAMLESLMSVKSILTTPVLKAGAKLSKASKDMIIEACRSISAGHDCLKEMCESAVDGTGSDGAADDVPGTSSKTLDPAAVVLKTADEAAAALRLQGKQKRLRQVETDRLYSPAGNI